VEPAAAPILEVRNLEVVYSDVILVLRGVSLRVATGDVVALLGANGAGKTTLLRAITGLLNVHRGKVTKGQVAVDGEEVTHADAAETVRRGIAQVMEGRRIFPPLTVEENLRTGGFTRTDKAELKNSYERVMELFPKLAERRRQVAGYLSGGEQQMLAIGRALMASPRLLLLDEPSLGLAPRLREEVFFSIARVHESGIPVLLVEQEVGQAFRMSERNYVLSQGKIVAQGSAAQLMADETLRAGYLGL